MLRRLGHVEVGGEGCDGVWGEGGGIEDRDENVEAWYYGLVLAENLAMLKDSQEEVLTLWLRPNTWCRFVERKSRASQK